MPDSSLPTNDICNRTRPLEAPEGGVSPYAEISNLVGATSTEQAVRRILSTLMRLLGSSSALLLLAERLGCTMKLAGSSGLTPEQELYFAGFTLNLDDVSRQALRNCKLGLIWEIDAPSVLNANLREALEAWGPRNALLVPLAIDNQVVALVVLSQAHVEQIDAATREYVKYYAVDAAGILEHLLIIGNLNMGMNNIFSLSNAANSLTDVTSLRRLLYQAVQNVEPLVRGAKVGLITCDDDGNNLCTAFSPALSWRLALAYIDVARQSIASQATEAEVHICGLADEFSRSDLGLLLEKSGFWASLHAPMVLRSSGILKITGLLVLALPSDSVWDAYYCKMIENLACRLAVSVENARLYTSLQCDMQVMEKVNLVRHFCSEAMSQGTLELEGSLVSAVRRCSRSSMGCLYRKNIDRHCLQLVAQSPHEITMPPYLEEDAFAHLFNKSALCAECYVHLDSQIFPRWMQEMGFKSLAVTRLQGRSRQGILLMARQRYLRYSDADVNFFKQVAREGASAIDRARAYELKRNVMEIFSNALNWESDCKVPGLEFGFFYQASQEMSGDYYDIIPLGHQRYGIVIADVTGKGPQAAVYTLKVKHLLRAYAMAGLSPGELISNLNNQLVRDSNTFDRQVTVFYAEWDLEKRRMRYARGGHEPAIFFNRYDDEEPILLSPQGLLMGIFCDPTVEEGVLPLPSGSRLLLYTDGVLEASRLQHNSLDAEGIVELVRSSRSLPCQALTDKLAGMVQAGADNSLTDDTTILLVEAI